MQSWFTIWAHADRFLLGFGNTLLLFLLSSAMGFIAACMLVYLLEGRQHLGRRGLRALLDLVRMSPFLFYVYLLYYVLPEIGIRFDAWTAGILEIGRAHV